LRSDRKIGYRGLKMSEPSTPTLMRHICGQVLPGEDAKETPRAFVETCQPQ
jgi:hypothetical protein